MSHAHPRPPRSRPAFQPNSHHQQGKKWPHSIGGKRSLKRVIGGSALRSLSGTARQTSIDGGIQKNPAGAGSCFGSSPGIPWGTTHRQISLYRRRLPAPRKHSYATVHQLSTSHHSEGGFYTVSERIVPDSFTHPLARPDQPEKDIQDFGLNFLKVLNTDI